jgi:hypothetical protein
MGPAIARIGVFHSRVHARARGGDPVTPNGVNPYPDQ